MLFRILSIASIAFGALAPLSAEAGSRCGIASWYGPGFHGSRTASGERFNSHGLTAAHRNLPFGTRLKVLNPSNGRSVIIRVNDDGPHIAGRMLDLSQGAFARIASTGQGIAKVCYSKV